MQPYKRSLAEYADITGTLTRCNPDEIISLAMLAGANFHGSEQWGWRAHPHAMARMSRPRAALDYLIGCGIPVPEKVTP